MVLDIHAKFHIQQFIMRRAIKPVLTLFVQPHAQQAGIFREDDLKWRTFKFTLELLEPHWPDSEQGSDVIHGSGLTHVPMCTVVLCIVHSSTLYAVSGTMRTYNFPYFVTYPSESCVKDTFNCLRHLFVWPIATVANLKHVKYVN